MVEVYQVLLIITLLRLLHLESPLLLLVGRLQFSQYQRIKSIFGTMKLLIIQLDLLLLPFLVLLVHMEIKVIQGQVLYLLRQNIIYQIVKHPKQADHGLQRHLLGAKANIYGHVIKLFMRIHQIQYIQHQFVITHGKL